MKASDVKIGMRVRVVNSNVGGHGYKIGSVMFVHSGLSHGNPPYWYLSTTAGGRKGSWVIYETEMEPAFADRAEEADFYEKEAEQLISGSKKLLEKAAKLRKFKDDDEELAYVAAEAIKSGGDAEAIYKLIKGLRATREE